MTAIYSMIDLKDTFKIISVHRYIKYKEVPGTWIKSSH